MPASAGIGQIEFEATCDGRIMCVCSNCYRYLDTDNSLMLGFVKSG